MLVNNIFTANIFGVNLIKTNVHAHIFRKDIFYSRSIYSIHKADEEEGRKVPWSICTIIFLIMSNYLFGRHHTFLMK